MLSIRQTSSAAVYARSIYCECELICVVVPAGAPLNFTAIGVSSTSVRLQWDPPARQHRNGEIVLYELLYHDRRNPADDWPTNTTETSIVIDGLQPTTNYIFQIRAYTGKGPGPWSNQLPFQTFAAQRALLAAVDKIVVLLSPCIVVRISRTSAENC